MNDVMENEELEYVGFWARVLACVVDSVLWCIVSWPLLLLLGGQFNWNYSYQSTFSAPPVNTHGGFSQHFGNSSLQLHGLTGLLMDWLLPAIVVIVFWLYKSATPGKMLLGARVVDAKTGLPLTMRQAIWRYLGYFISIFPFFLGLIWVGINARKQGWHDMLAGSVVVRRKARAPAFLPPR